MSKHDHSEDMADGDWWREVAAAIGATLIGWTYRSTASVCRDSGSSIEIPGWLALEILRLKAGIK